MNQNIGNNSVGGENNGAVKKPPLLGADASRQASYRSISRMTVASRSTSGSSASTAVTGTTMNSSASQVYRGFTPRSAGSTAVEVRQSNTSTSSFMTPAGRVKAQMQGSTTSSMMVSTLSPNAVIMKTGTSTITALNSSVTTFTDLPCLAREFPVADFPLARTNVTIKEVSQLDPCMKVICKSLGGELKPAKGCVRAKQLDHETDVKVCAYRDSKSGKIVLEFNRLDGCAFTFQKAFIKAKLDAVDYLDSVDKVSLETELSSIEKKLAFWYGNTSIDALAALSTGVAGTPLIGKATAV